MGGGGGGVFVGVWAGKAEVFRLNDGYMDELVVLVLVWGS